MNMHVPRGTSAERRARAQILFHVEHRPAHVRPRSVETLRPHDAGCGCPRAKGRSCHVPPARWSRLPPSVSAIARRADSTGARSSTPDGGAAVTRGPAGQRMMHGAQASYARIAPGAEAPGSDASATAAVVEGGTGGSRAADFQALATAVAVEGRAARKPSSGALYLTGGGGEVGRPHPDCGGGRPGRAVGSL
jgi:hypothetical protein